MQKKPPGPKSSRASCAIRSDRGADWIKIYADYRWGAGGTARPAFTQSELNLVVEIAESSGRHVVAHATTPEGMRRAILAGVKTIDHGDDGTPEIFRLMKERGVVLVPTVAAGDAVLQYGGWKKGSGPEPARITAKRVSVSAAIDAGVMIANGSDVGVFAHGTNARELLMHGRVRLNTDTGVGVSHIDGSAGAGHGRPDRARRAWTAGGSGGRRG